MRIPIREQLALLILLSALVGLAVVSIATWLTVYKIVLTSRSNRLAYIAALKAAQLTSNLNIMVTSANFVTTRIIIQNAIQAYNNGTATNASWAGAETDMRAALGSTKSPGQALLHQARIYPKSPSGPLGPYALLNLTDDAILNRIALPYSHANGTPVYLGESGLGYPPDLYPNLTYSSGKAYYDGIPMDDRSSDLVLGPFFHNATSALVSVTTTVVNNTAEADVLGYLTVVMDAALILQVVRAREGLDNTGQTLIVTPNNRTNRLPPSFTGASSDQLKSQAADLQVQFITLITNDSDRHPDHVYGTPNLPFTASQYPAIACAFAENNTAVESSGSLVATQNEHGDDVSTGFAAMNTDRVNWVILVEQARSEVWQAITTLRNVILACVFGTAGFLAVVAFPLAHFAVLPIRRLRAATKRSIEPPAASRSSQDSIASHLDSLDGNRSDVDDETAVIASKEGFRQHVNRWRKRRNTRQESRKEARRKHEFRIPGKVKERKHLVKDELSDLTATFNEMSDELMMQYTKLEERVQQRTAELELSKKAAEVANESKTLFIANISHELKTPLNGILGMCAVCMQEDDPIRLKRELGVIYKSGDILLNLLNDLLQFTRNQVGQHIALEERDFRLREVSSQILAIFDKQAKDSHIKLRVDFQGAEELIADGDAGDGEQVASYFNVISSNGRVKDYILWGDVHRILQVLINLVSNSLKFTPAGGSVVLTIRCLLEQAPDRLSKRGSMSSRQSKATSRTRASGATNTGVRSHANSPKDRPSIHAVAQESAASPPPGQFFYFEFEVQDTGPGIPQDQQQRIFEPFVQGDLGLSKKYGGTGLGLSICSQLASLMHGSIWVQSTVGTGSTFTMKIPLRHLQTRRDSNASSAFEVPREPRPRLGSVDDGDLKTRRGRRASGDEKDADTRSESSTGEAVTSAAAAQDAQPRLVGLSQPFFAASQPLESPGSQPAAAERIAAEATRSGKIRVLVAEDNKVNQEVVLRMLKLEDIYDVTVASDGQMALDLVKENMAQNNQPFNLIFMDIQMPNVDGLQSTKMIREMGYQAPIVALTAFAEESNIKDCMDSGMNYFLSKPIRRPQLKKVLKEYCAPIPEESELELADAGHDKTNGVVEVVEPPKREGEQSGNVDDSLAKSEQVSDKKPEHEG